MRIAGLQKPCELRWDSQGPKLMPEASSQHCGVQLKPACVHEQDGLNFAQIWLQDPPTPSCNHGLLLFSFDAISKQLSDVNFPPRMGVRFRPLFWPLELMYFAPRRVYTYPIINQALMCLLARDNKRWLSESVQSGLTPRNVEWAHPNRHPTRRFHCLSISTGPQHSLA